jgi:hypothetical protein
MTPDTTNAVLTERRQRLVDELRSGSWDQTYGVLRRLAVRSDAPVGFCCLGVACQLAVKSGLDVLIELGTYHQAFDGQESTLPDSVQSYYEFSSNDGTFYGSSIDLASSLVLLNDNGKTFGEIADAIVTYQDDLFTTQSEPRLH